MGNKGEVAVSEIDPKLARRCAISTRMWGRMFSGLTAVTYRELGEAALHKLWFDVLCNHQVDRYREGLEKLGIHEDTPAVAAAKYHYHTNIIGGLDMEYCEESDCKAWIRYKAPMWVYDGVGMLAMPGGLRRTIFSAWHPRNGRLMGCPRLGYVGTKFIMEGEPYDEGYFFEYDHDLAPEEIYRFEHVTRTPEFDLETAPKLDREAWPEERLLRARRNFSSGYARETVNALLASHGEMQAHHIVAKTMRMLAIQYTWEMREALGIEGTGAADCTALFTGLLDACFQRFSMERLNDRAYRIGIDTFKPFDDDAPEALREAMFEFQRMAVRVTNGRIRVTRERRPDGGEAWTVEDAGRWLW